MSAQGILKDLIADHWNNLTPEQQLCWRFYAATHPRPDRQGRLTTQTGYQCFYAANCITATHATPAWTDEPPHTEPEQPVLDITGAAWARSVRLWNGTTGLSGFAWLEINTPLAAGTYAAVTQAYYNQRRDPKKLSRIRHTNVLGPGDTGVVNLQTPSGYYAETAGANKFARIKGLGARRDRRRPLATLKIAVLDGAAGWRQIIPNPIIGAATLIKRAVHKDP